MTTDRERCGITAGYRVPDGVHAMLWLIGILVAFVVVFGGLGRLIPELGALLRFIGSMGTWDEAALLLPGLTGRRLPRFRLTPRAVLGFWRRWVRGSTPRRFTFDERQRFEVQTDLELDSYSNWVTVKRRLDPPFRLADRRQYLVNDYGLTEAGLP